MPRAVVITVSDSRAAGTNPDRSGPAVAERLKSAGFEIAGVEIVPDELPRITAIVREWLPRAALIVTTGGTGIAARDVTPEAIAPLLDKPLPGFGEIMRCKSYDATPLSIIARSGAGIADRTLVVWLPGSPRAVAECLDLILPAVRHIMQLYLGPGADCAAASHPSAARTTPE
ncbi:MAG: MogA/MoaB family molybdenum cofactor biosynthesis protein [Phycisphaerae bacterium]|nr:MogA/MoaB family molybdenum cofactor biosynthesis protein [Phycisphaerae bacterium]